MHQFQPSSLPCMNARCFNGPRTLVSNKLRHFHGGRNESVFSSHAFLPALPPRCPSARKENEYPAPFPPIWTLSQAGDTLFSNQPFRLPEKVCNCIHSVHPSCQIISFLSSDGRLNMLNPIKRPFSAPYVSASQSLFAACMKKCGLNGHAIPFKPPCLQDFHDRRNSR